MFTTCFDAGGKTPSTTTKNPAKKAKNPVDSPVMSVVGFGSQAGVWAEFDELWSKVLKHFDVPHFHAGDFAWSRWPFNESWKDEEQKRRDFQSELMDVIQTCGLRKFGSVLWVSDQHKAKKVDGLETDSTATPYVMCARAAVEDVNAYMRGYPEQNVEYIFEKGDEEDKLRKHFEKHGFHEPDFRWGKPVEKKGITRPPFLGLQAAGWITWEYYLSFHRWFAEMFKHDPVGRWALKIFDDRRCIPGEVKVLYKSAPFADFARQVQESFVDLSQNVIEATKRIETAKRDGMK